MDKKSFEILNKFLERKMINEKDKQSLKVRFIKIKKTQFYFHNSKNFKLYINFLSR